MAFDAFANEDRSGPAVYVLKQSGKPGRYKLLERFSYLDRTRPDFHFVVPRDKDLFVTDLASIPQLLTWLVPKDGTHTPAAYLHDALVRPGSPPAYEWRGSGRQLEDRFEADIVFRNAMRSLGVSFARSWMMWAAVSLTTLLKSAGRWWWRLVIGVVCVVFGLGGIVQLLDLADVHVATGIRWELPWMSDRPWHLELRNALLVDSAAIVVSLVLWARRWQVGLVMAPAALLLGFPLLLCAVAYAIYLLLEFSFTFLAGWLAASTPLDVATMSPPGLPHVVLGEGTTRAPQIESTP